MYFPTVNDERSSSGILIHWQNCNLQFLYPAFLLGGGGSISKTIRVYGVNTSYVLRKPVDDSKINMKHPPNRLMDKRCHTEKLLFPSFNNTNALRVYTILVTLHEQVTR